MRPLPAAARVPPVYGAAPNLQILGVSIPFFSEPSTKRGFGEKASSGSVYPLIETRQVEGDNAAIRILGKGKRCAEDCRCRCNCNAQSRQ